MPVQNMLLYPGHEHYAHYEPSASGVSGSVGSGVSGNSIQQNAALMLGSMTGGSSSSAGSNGAAAATATTEPSYPFFSLRPLIDSIFEVSARAPICIIKRTPAEFCLPELVGNPLCGNLCTLCLIVTISHTQIPISTLRAVNNLVGRLTGSYRQAGPEMMQKSVSIDANTPLRLPPGNSVPLDSNFKLSTTANAGQQRRPAMREELA